jgi:hypothetical protein
LVQPVPVQPSDESVAGVSEITVKVSEESSTGSNMFIRNKPLTSVDKEFAHIYTSLFKNGGNYLAYVPLTEEGDMLIIATSSFMSSMYPFMEWKARRGLRCQLVDVATIGNTPAAIKTYIQNYYASQGLNMS